MNNIICVLTSYNYREDASALEEDDLILLFDVLHHTNEVVTVAEAAESLKMKEMAVDEVQYERIPRKRKRRFEGDFYTMNRQVNKQINVGKFGDQGNSAKFSGSRGTWAKNILGII